MTKSRFSASQIMEVLKRADAGVKVLDICRELGVRSATFYKWRPKHQRHTAKALCAWI